MRLETSRLVLRELQIDDAAAFSTYNERPEFYRHVARMPTTSVTRELIERNVARNKALPRRYWYFTLILSMTTDIVGTIGISSDEKYPENMASIGYTVHPDHWGKGLASEALNAMTLYAHDTLKFHRIEINADIENIGSWRVMEKCGYLREGVLNYGFKSASGWCEKIVQYASVRPDLIA